MRSILRLIYFLIVLTTFSGCAGYKYLTNDQKLLYSQKIKSGKVFDKYTLEDLFVQKANVKFPPYAAMYQKGLSNFDTAYYVQKRLTLDSTYSLKIKKASKPKRIARLEQKRQTKIQKIDKKLKEGNNFMQWGEPLAIFDSAGIEQNKANLRQFLFNNGYFTNSIKYLIEYKGHGKNKGKKVIVTYQIKENPPYKIDTLIFRSSDSTLLPYLQTSRKKSFIKPGENYSQKKFNKERERLEYFFKDNGFYNFSRQFVRYEIDTTYGSFDERKVGVRMHVSKPSNDIHKQYRIDTVQLIVNPPDGTRPQRYIEKSRRGIKYRVYEDIFSTKMLNRSIFIRQDSLYSRSKTLKTQQQLANLDNFKFININYDSTGNQFVANIFTSPLNRYQWSHELGLNVTQGFPGPFYNLTFKKRNIFRGLENFEISGRYGIEGVATPGDANELYQNKELGFNASLTFPQFLFPAFIYQPSIRVENPRTRILVGYTDTDRFDYRRTNVNFSNTFTWQNANDVFYSFAVTDLSIINTTKLSDEFKTRLEQLSSRLINSFEPSFVSAMKFTMFQTKVNSDQVPAVRTSYYRLQLESGGTFLNIMPTQPLVVRGLEYFKYVKLDLDFAKSKPLSAVSDIAFRINMGMAIPYADNRSLPYEKYLFAGGSNGIRAWRPRRLGPGSYTPLQEGTITYRLEQQGELLLQSSIEYRRALFGFVESALFIDAGNIWMLTDDDNRPGAKFELKNFYNQIAVGTGVGLRFDFSFLIMRFDVGIKTLDPAREPGKRFIFSDGFFDAPFNNNRDAELLVFNIGVGYPF